MHEPVILATSLTLLHLLIQLALVLRALLRPHRQPASRIAWIVVILAVPVLGICAYLLFGEVNVGRKRVARMRAVLDQLPDVSAAPGAEAVHAHADLPEAYRSLFRVATSINGFAPMTGNRAQLMADSNSTIDAMVADIDGAQEHVHLLFYIWLPDNNGCKMIEAITRAARRGVVCRVMVDGLGSRLLLGSKHWRDMGAAGVRLATALPVGNPVLRIFDGRIDLRNHRKIVVIDERITYCGSQNCADPEFRVKPRYAPWVDAVMRFEGPVARQNQHLFAGDWMAQVDDDIDELLRRPLDPSSPGFTAQAFGTGPTMRVSAMPEVFEATMYAAQRELVITTPYYIPDEAMQTALCASARRGVAVTIVFPARNDSWIVAAASRSYYQELLEAGVRICEYSGGLLHTKSMVVDGQLTLIGSANMDRRSFELNYENNILLYDPVLSARMRERQQSYIAQSTPVTEATVKSWPLHRQLWNNALAMLGPVL
jgi:cardiolipin synthase